MSGRCNGRRGVHTSPEVLQAGARDDGGLVDRVEKVVVQADHQQSEQQDPAVSVDVVGPRLPIEPTICLARAAVPAQDRSVLDGLPCGSHVLVAAKVVRHYAG